MKLCESSGTLAVYVGVPVSKTHWVSSHMLKVNEFIHLTASEFVSQHTVYKLMNVWSALKHLRAHEHVEGSREFNHGGSGGTSEEPGTVYLVQLLDCITIVSACNGELMNNSFAFAMKNAMCSEASCLNQGHLQDFLLQVEFAHGRVTSYKDVP